MRLGVVGLDAYRFRPVADGLVGISFVKQGGPQIAVRFGVVGVEL